MRLPGPTDYLAEWFERFITNRDLVFKKLSSVKREGNKVIVEQKDGKKIHYHIEPFVHDFVKATLYPEEEHKGLVIYNTPENFAKLIEAWTDIEQVQNLTIFFVNPFSKLDKRWAINPRTHSLITDKESLEPGLRSMYAMVDGITQKEIEKLTT
jgi:hypothetical protein